MIKKTTHIILFLYCSIYSFNSNAEWRAVYDKHPVTQDAQCLLKSEVKKVYDGKDYAKVSLLLNEHDLFVITDSNIDMSFQQLGLRVDENPFQPLTKVMQEKNVVFEGFSQSDVKQLRKGKEAKLGLGFWPSWPKTRLRKVRFSLMGFSKAHNQFMHCVEDQKK